MLEKMNEGVFACRAAVVAAAVEVRDEAKRGVALAALAGEIRTRILTPHSEFVDMEQAFSSARATVNAAMPGKDA